MYVFGTHKIVLDITLKRQVMKFNASTKLKNMIIIFILHF